MSYTKQTHVAGQKLTAAQLNHMENGIVAAQNAYNLLDNSDFKNPVNQRGLSSTTTSQTYIIDRWVTDIANNAATVSVNSNGITCASTSTNYAGIRQNFAKYSEMAGKTYTFAVCVGGVWEATTFVMGQHAGGSLLSNGASFFSVEQGHVIIRSVNGATITFEKVALYEGSYTTETLPAYVPKGYAAELMECQRYYLPLMSEPLGFGYINGAGTSAYINVPIPQTMRILPSLPANRTLYVRDGDSKQAVSTTFNVDSMSANSVRIIIQTEGLVANTACSAFGHELYFSADL